MNQDIAFYSGQILPVDQLVVRPQDLGFIWGATISEQLRTFGGKLFRIDEHLQRLRLGLEVVELSDLISDSLVHAIEHITAHNFARLDADHDLGITVFVTPGLADDGRSVNEPTVASYSFPLPFSKWAVQYRSGQPCVISSVPQVDPACWPRYLKCRSRMHYYLADQEARLRDQSARAILLDGEGNVNEASTANIVAFFAKEGFVSPPLDSVLPGVSLRFVEQLATDLGYPFHYRAIPVEDFRSADEILLTSTPFCLLPVSRLDNRTLSQRQRYQQLIGAWSEQVGVDIPAQARRFA